jgi:predicted phosphoribosyltransferase
MNRFGQTLFRDRAEAGQRLAKGLDHFAGRSDVQVLATPTSEGPTRAYRRSTRIGAHLFCLVAAERLGSGIEIPSF